MRGQRITSMGEAAPAGRSLAARLMAAHPAAPRSIVRTARGTSVHTKCRIAAALAAGLSLATPAAAAHRCMILDTSASATRRLSQGAVRGPAADRAGPGLVVAVAAPADETVAAGDAPAAPDAAVPAAQAAGPAGSFSPGARPLGRAVGMLAARHQGGRSRHAAEPMPGCAGMATLDGVSAALQAGPFGRGKGLAIMQFRGVVTESAEDGRVACHSDVLLSDGSLHRAEYGLRRVHRGTQLHIEVDRDGEDVGAAGDASAQGQPTAVPPASGASSPPGPRTPAT